MRTKDRPKHTYQIASLMCNRQLRTHIDLGSKTVTRNIPAGTGGGLQSNGSTQPALLLLLLD
jgi:hypothetical protein